LIFLLFINTDADTVHIGGLTTFRQSPLSKNTPNVIQGCTHVVITILSKISGYRGYPNQPRNIIYLFYLKTYSLLLNTDLFINATVTVNANTFLLGHVASARHAG